MGVSDTCLPTFHTTTKFELPPSFRLQSITIDISDMTRYRISGSYLTSNQRDLNSFILSCCVQDQLYHPPQFVPHRKPCLSVTKTNHDQLHINMPDLHVNVCNFCQILIKIGRRLCILVEVSKLKFNQNPSGESRVFFLYTNGWTDRHDVASCLFSQQLCEKCPKMHENFKCKNLQ